MNGVPNFMGFRFGGITAAVTPYNYIAWSWGRRTGGVLGIGLDGSNYAATSKPTAITGHNDWSYISTNEGSANGTTLAVKKTGTLWGWGYNFRRLLSNFAASTFLSPIQIGTGNDWKTVKIGRSNQAFMLKTNNALFVQGDNNEGMLGLGDTTVRSSPVQLGTNTDWAFVSPFDKTVLAIKTNGTLWGWGRNSSGEIGDRTTTQRTSPVQIGNDTNWSKVYMGSNNAVALKTNGTMWVWGAQSYALGVGGATNLSSPVQVGSNTNWIRASKGGNSPFATSAAIRTNGTLWTWGSGLNGRLGLGNTSNKSTPTQVGANTDWTDVMCLRDSMIARRSNGTLWAWGSQLRWPVLGLGISNVTVESPLQIGSGSNWTSLSEEPGLRHSHAIDSSGRLWGWGFNTNGQVGINSTITARYGPVQVGTGSTDNWSYVTNGRFHTIAARSDGTLWAWGQNTSGQLGDGTVTNRSSPVQIDSGLTSWTRIACSSNNTAIIRSNGTLWIWGGNFRGQLGQGNTTSASSPVQVGTDTDWVDVSTSSETTFAIKTNGTLWGWGRNDVSFTTLFGQWSAATNVSSPIQIGSGSTGNWQRVYQGYMSVFAKKTDGTLWAWGRNLVGQLGRGNRDSLSSPLQVGSATDWLTISTYSYSVLARRQSGSTGASLWAWGDNNNLQLGISLTAGQGQPIAFSSPVQVGTDTDWTSAKIGGFMGLGLKANGSIWGWGRRDNGECGITGLTYVSSPVQIGTSASWSSGSNEGKPRVHLGGNAYSGIWLQKTPS